MAIRAQTFAGTPSTSALWQPYIAPGQLLAGIGGIALGPDLRTGELVVIDPPMLQQLRIIHSMIIDVFGDKNGGKTTFMRTFFRRMMCLQAGQRQGKPIAVRGRINARKPEGDGDGNTDNEESEYKKLADSMQSEVFSPAEQGSVNIFDPAMSMSYADLLQTAVNVCELMKEKALDGLEPFVLQIAVWKMQRDYKLLTHPQVLQVVVRTLDHRDDVDAYYDATNTDILVPFEDVLFENPELAVQLKSTMVKPAKINELAFAEAVGNVGSYLAQLTHGVTGSLFRGNGSLYDIMSRDMVTVDWDRITGKARSVLESMIWEWQMLNPELRPHVNLSDELGTSLDSMMQARYYYKFVKKARAYATCDISGTQYRFDISHKGAPGSELRGLVEGILLGVGMQLFTRQPENDDVLDDIAQLGVSDLDCDYMTKLPVGCFGIKVPERPISFFQLVLTPSDWKYNQSNAASAGMINRQNVWNDEKFRARARRQGIKRIGEER